MVVDQWGLTLQYFRLLSIAVVCVVHVDDQSAGLWVEFGEQFICVSSRVDIKREANIPSMKGAMSAIYV